jgi:hypothetical protein
MASFISALAGCCSWQLPLQPMLARDSLAVSLEEAKVLLVAFRQRHPLGAALG